MKAVLVAVALCIGATFAAPVLAHEDEVELYINKGEIQKIDMKKATITLKHEPLTHVRMPAGTNVFPVRDPKILQQAKPGDKVRFVARNINGTVYIKTLESDDGKQQPHTH